jgi:hypothetical protein
MPEVGRRQWVIADGWIPPWSSGFDPAVISHEAACMLNAGESNAEVRFTVFFADAEPQGPVHVTIPARRLLRQNLEALPDPVKIPPGTHYCILIESDVPIVVQHTRLDARQAENALMTTIAFPGG